VITIRTLDEEDWPVWRRLRLAALAEAPGAFNTRLSDWSGPGDLEERWRERLRSVTANFLLSRDDEPAGIVSAHLLGRDTVQLMSLWVAPSSRGHGVADAAMHHVIDWAGQRGAGWILLGVKSGNAPAIALYQRSGFVDIGPDPDRGDERLMRRRTGT
jgi:ribosomal protein S18 acetylase RimI-like enzyme